MIALGTPVAYHHRAAVARWTPPKSDFSWLKGWTLFEGVKRHSWNSEYVKYDSMFARWPEIKTRRDQTINKTVMVWPEDGSGVVTGRVRRQRGISHRSTGGGDDYDPGYFDCHDTFRLYVVRHTLDGLDYILIPEWAISPVIHA